MEGFVCVSATLQCGVYALLYEGEVVYVGKARKLLTRLYTHRSNWDRWVKKRQRGFGKPMKFDEVRVRACAWSEVAALEQQMIDRYKPKHNQQHKRPGKITTPVELTIGKTKVVLNGPRPQVQRPVIERRPLYVEPAPAPLVLVPLAPPKPEPVGRAYWDAPLERRI